MKEGKKEGWGGYIQGMRIGKKWLTCIFSIDGVDQARGGSLGLHRLPPLPDGLVGGLHPASRHNLLSSSIWFCTWYTVEVMLAQAVVDAAVTVA